jgi:hypothetical protein
MTLTENAPTKAKFPKGLSRFCSIKDHKGDPENEKTSHLANSEEK